MWLAEIVDRIRRIKPKGSGKVLWGTDGDELSYIEIGYFPLWFIDLCYEMKTIIYFKHKKPEFMEVVTYTGYDPYDVDALAKAIPLSEWDSVPFMDHGMTEETYDYYYLYLPPWTEIVAEEFITDLRDDPSMKFKLRLVGRIELKNMDQMWCVLENLAKDRGDQSWRRLPY